MKKTYQTPFAEVIELLAEDIMDGSIVDIMGGSIVEPTDEKKTPVEIGPAIDIFG